LVPFSKETLPRELSPGPPIQVLLELAAVSENLFSFSNSSFFLKILCVVDLFFLIFKIPHQSMLIV
jgi:hypothetical protein